MPRISDRTGQASVELVALLPLLAVIALGLWQAVVAGQAMWLAGTAARAAARADALGQDARGAARATLPHPLRGGLDVHAQADGRGVRVRLAIPLVVSGARLATVSARARFAPQR